MNVIIAPDSFKGTLSALQAARAIEVGVRRVFPQAAIQLFPMADGGEGTLDAVLFAMEGERRLAMVSGVTGHPLQAAYGVIHGDTAVIEAAQVVGLALAGETAVAARTTFGLGELIRHCLDGGLRRFLIGLGGSSTNDGGAGLLAALGVQLLDAQGKLIAPTPAGLADLARVDFTDCDDRLAQCDLVLLSDVDNPLCGASGATATFGPQKGVMPDQIALFDERLATLARLCDAATGHALVQAPGAGAAGGLGYALMLLGGQRRAGAEVMCELMRLDDALLQADWAITGEGRSDAQTLHGKLPWVLSRHARQAGVPVALLSGAIDEASRAALASAFDACRALVEGGVTVERAMREGEHYLAVRAAELARDFKRR